MIGDAPDAWAAATGVAGDRGEIGVERGADGIAQDRSSVLRAEHEVEEDVVERLRHGERFT